jgi:hypothetical protein
MAGIRSVSSTRCVGVSLPLAVFLDRPTRRTGPLFEEIIWQVSFIQVDGGAMVPSRHDPAGDWRGGIGRGEANEMELGRLGDNPIALQTTSARRRRKRVATGTGHFRRSEDLVPIGTNQPRRDEKRAPLGLPPDRRRRKWVSIRPSPVRRRCNWVSIRPRRSRRRCNWVSRRPRRLRRRCNWVSRRACRVRPRCNWVSSRPWRVRRGHVWEAFVMPPGGVLDRALAKVARRKQRWRNG